MDLEKLLEKLTIERKRYLDFFKEETESLKVGKDTFAIELAIQNDDETVPEPFNIIRVDFISKDETEQHDISELRLDKNLKYKGFTFLYKTLKVKFKPFCWNSCEILTDKIEIKGLRAWVIKWLRIDEEDEDELSNAIHSCTEPEMSNNGFLFIVDFGTAPESAMIELLEYLCDCGATEVNIDTTSI